MAPDSPRSLLAWPFRRPASSARIADSNGLDVPSALNAADERPTDISRMIGYCVATNCGDYAFVLEICEKASKSEADAKEAAAALRREFKYGELLSQLAAAKLWATMLRNTSDLFVQQCVARRFLDTVEDVITGARTGPVVRERLLDVLAAAAYASKPEIRAQSLQALAISNESSGHHHANQDSKDDRKGFRGLWIKVKPNDKPLEGYPFSNYDPMFDPPPAQVVKSPTTSEPSQYIPLSKTSLQDASSQRQGTMLGLSPPKSQPKAVIVIDRPRVSESSVTIEEAKAAKEPSRAYRHFMTACQGFTSLMKLVEPALEGTPFKSPISVFVAVAEAVQAATDTQQKADITLGDLSERLRDISQYFGDSNSVSSQQMMSAYAKELVRNAQDVLKIQSQSALKRAAQAEDVKSKLQEVLTQIDRETNNFHTRILLEIEKDAKDTRKRLLRSDAKTWNRAPSAQYTADAQENQPRRQSCTPGTRVDILGRILQWAVDPSSPVIFWLSGMAGSGKSTIAHTVCQQLSEDSHAGVTLGASFFCSRQVPDLRRSANVVPTLAYQLAERSRRFALALDAVNHAVLSTSGQHVEKLLLEPWLVSLDSNPDQLSISPTLIVIDALDELESDQGAELLKRLVENTSKLRRGGARKLRILVTSRPHPDIVRLGAQLERNAVCRLEDIEKSLGRQDILTYFKDKLPDLAGDHSDLLEQLADRSDGLFIYAATVARKLSPSDSSHRLTKRERREELSNFLHGRQTSSLTHLDAVHDLYKQVIRESIPGDYLRRRLPILHRIICTMQPLPAQALARIADVDSEDDVDPDAPNFLVQALHAVLYVSEADGCVYVYHKSFSDFLSDDQLCGRELACAADAQNAAISRACLRIMRTSLRFNICNLPSSYLLDSEVPDLATAVKTSILDVPGLEYGCRYWASHVVRVSDTEAGCQSLCERLSRFMEEDVLFWMETVSLLKADAHRGLAGVAEWVERQPCAPAQLKEILACTARLCDSFFLTASSLSTPHLYTSSLATELFLHPDAPVSWQKQFSGLPRVYSKAASHQGDVFAHIHADTVIGAVGFSLSGTRVASASDDKHVRVWDVSTGAAVQTLSGHSAAATSVAFMLNDKYIVSGSADRSLRIWDVSTGAEVHRLVGHTGEVRSVAVSHDARVVSGSVDKSIRIWDASDGVEMNKFTGHTDWVNSVAFSPAGTHIVSGSEDKSVRIWNLSTHAEVHMLTGHTGAVNSVAWSADGARIASGSDDASVQIWDALSGAAVRRIRLHSNWIRSVAFSPGGTHVVSGSDDKTVRVCNTSTGGELYKLVGHSRVVRSVAFSPDGVHIVSGSDDESVRIWVKVAEHDGPAVAWVADPSSGWLLSRASNKRMLWLPSQLHKDLYDGSARQLAFSGNERICVDFTDACIGVDWFKCHQSSHDAEGSR